MVSCATSTFRGRTWLLGSAPTTDNLKMLALAIAIASGVVTGSRDRVRSSPVHPYLQGSKFTGSCSRVDFQMYVYVHTILTFS